MFIVHDGVVTDRFRWNSYTSRDHGPWNPHVGAFGTAAGWDQLLSAIVGNRAYFYESFRSGNNFINYTWAVTDVTPMDGGVRHDLTDACADAWFYFGTPEAAGTLDTHVTQDLGAFGGKSAIRIHRGNRGGEGCGSAGCIVSTRSANFRGRLTAIYRREFEDFHGHGSIDTFVNAVCTTPECECAHYNPPHVPPIPHDCTGAWPAVATGLVPSDPGSAEWDQKLGGVFWLIRPDEPPPS